MIYTLGDSFTKWWWPTWSDWLGKYTNQPIANLAYPGFTNTLMYYQLLALKQNLSSQDTVYIMWTGSNRVCEWYDQEYIEQEQCKGFFPPTQGQLWFSKQPWQGLYKTHPNHLPSITNMIIDNFDIMLKTQWLLDSIGCDYYMMFWQNPWLDTRETFVPTYKGSWDSKNNITKVELDRAHQLLQLEPLQAIIKSLNWNRFVNAPVDISDPEHYQGLWEFTLDDRTLVTLNHTSDPHPNALAHHDWTVRYLVQGTNHHRDLAHQLALDTQNIPIPGYNFTECVQGSSAKLCNLL